MQLPRFLQSRASKHQHRKAGLGATPLRRREREIGHALAPEKHSLYKQAEAEPSRNPGAGKADLASIRASEQLRKDWTHVSFGRCISGV